MDFKANFKISTIEVATGLKSYTSKNKIKEGTVLLKVNGINVSNFSHEEFCDFWTIAWPKIIDTDKLNIVISKRGKEKSLTITKKELF